MTSSDANKTDNCAWLVEPVNRLHGALPVPGDKSMSHRSIMFAAVAHGTTEVSGFLEGEDSLYTLSAFEQMGVHIERPSAGCVLVHGIGPGALQAPQAPLYLGNAGTGMRLMTGLLAGMQLPATLQGDESLGRRPMRRIVEPLKLMGARIGTSENGTPPLTLTASGQLHGIDYTCPMASAQVKSCILLAGLFADGVTSVHEPAITRDHTERMLRGFGVEVKVNGLTVSVQGGQSLTATSLEVPGDISSAAFFLVGAAMAPGSAVRLKGVGMNPTRAGIVEILRLMGADICVENERESAGEAVADLYVVGTRLHGIEVPESLVSLAIDEFPALFIAAAAADGETIVTGAEELRVKETDRIQVMVDGLQILGIDARATRDGVRIQGGKATGGTVDSGGDHRTAMAFSMASLIASDAITILDCANVNTSFPGYVDTARQAGLRIGETAACQAS